MSSILSDEFYEGLTGETASREATQTERVERRMPQPTLVIGLGGTGAEVASRLKQHLGVEYGRVQEHADMIKFLIFDTIGLTKQQNHDIVRSFSEADEEYVSLASDFNAYAYLQENYAKDRDLRDWWDNRYTVSPQYQEWGAKRVRQLGRLFLHHKHLQIESIIQQKVSDTCTLYEDLVRGQNLADVGSNFRVYIICSTCGGTGSGVYLDILYKVWRAVMTQGRVPEIRSFIFLPGIYEEEARKRSLELAQAHRANAYAFLKELDYFLSPGGDLNKYILDAKTRDPSQKVAIPGGNLVKYAYMIDRQLGNLGNLDRPEDAYDLVADAMYQMIVTPVGQEEEGVGLTNIDAVVEPSHMRQGKRTAYSSLGLSRVLFPRHTLQAQLVYRFLKDMIYMGFVSNQAWMDEAISKDERLSGLVQRLGYGNLEAIDNLSRLVFDFVAQVPSQADLTKVAVNERLDKLIKEKDLNDSRITEGLFLVDQRCRPFEKEAKREAVAAIINLVNNCEYGVVYAQKTVLAAKKQLRELLQQVRAEKHEYQEIKTEKQSQLNRRMAEVEKFAARSVVAFRARQIDKRSANIATLMRDLTEATFQERIAERKQRLLETLVGQEQVVEQHLADEEVVIDRRVEKSVIDRELDKLNRIEERLSAMADRAEEQAKDRGLAKADRGATITTQIFPPNVIERLESPAFRTIYAKEVGPATMSEHLKTILSRLVDMEELHGQGIYNLNDPDQELAVKKILIGIVSNYVRGLFKGMLNQTVSEAVVESVGPARFAEQVMSNLFELSQPCWNYNKQKANDPGMVDLPRTYSLGYKDPTSLPIPEGQNKPGLVRTADDHQITLLQAQHGLPLFALRIMPTLRADYKHYMHLAKSSGSQPLHLNQSWSRDINTLPDVKVTTQLDDEVILDFALGLFTDYLIHKKDPVILELIGRKSIDNRPLRGYVFSPNGTDYYAVNLIDSEGSLVMGATEHLSSAGRAEAAENFAGLPEVSRDATKLLGLLEGRKQYDLIPDIEEYLESMIVTESKRVDDEEERQVLKKEYEALQAYLEQLRYQKRRGLPLAG